MSSNVVSLPPGAVGGPFSVQPASPNDHTSSFLKHLLSHPCAPPLSLAQNGCGAVDGPFNSAVQPGVAAPNAAFGEHRWAFLDKDFTNRFARHLAPTGCVLYKAALCALFNQCRLGMDRAFTHWPGHLVIFPPLCHSPEMLPVR